MSVYKEIKTEFRNPQSLLAALADVGAIFDCPDAKSNIAKLTSHWRGNPAQDVAVAVNRENARRAGLGDYDGVGFRWTGDGYAVVQDRLDANSARITKSMDQLKQRYAFHEVTRQAKAKGYTVQTREENGTLRLTLVRR